MRLGLCAFASLLLAVSQALAAEAGPAPGPAVSEDAELEALLEEDPFFDEALDPAADRDPWENQNRRVFAFNRGLDTVLFDPVTVGYQFVVPRPGRQAIERVFLNLDAPILLVNQLLQLRLGDSAGTLGRFVLNSSFGVLGLFDPAADTFGLRRSEADFGQTLARYGVAPGPFVMLPVFGPSTARDALGTLVDQAADPLTYLLGPTQWWTLRGGEGLVVREAAAEQLWALEAGSVDFYAALRSAYLQSREAAVRREEPARAPAAGAAGLQPAPSPAARARMRSSSALIRASRSSRLRMETNSE